MSTTKPAPAAGKQPLPKVHVKPVVLLAALRRVKLAGGTAVSIHRNRKQVLLVGGNGDALVEITLAARVSGKVDVTVQLKALRDAVDSNGGEELVLEFDKEHIRVCHPPSLVTAIRCDRGGVKMRERPTRMLVHAVGSELNNLVRRTAPITSKDSTRPRLTGILLESATDKGDEAVAVATDSYRLLACPLPGATGQFRVVPDARGMLDACTGLKADEGVQLFDAGWVELLRAGERWQIHNHEPAVGTDYRPLYPAWEQLIPDGHAHVISFVCDRAQFLASSGVCARAAKANIRMALEIADHGLVLRQDPPPAAEGEEQQGRTVTANVPAEVKVLKGGERADRTAGYSAEFLASLLRGMTGEKVTCRYIGPLRPLAFRCGQEIGLLMPMKLAVDAAKPAKRKRSAAASRASDRAAEQAAASVANVMKAGRDAK